MQDFEELIPLTPVHFFAIQADCYYVKGKLLEKKHFLPDLSLFHGTSPFARVALGWNEEGIVATVYVNGPFEQSTFPDFRIGDSIELFFDTRDVKTRGYPTRFCHHFYFLPTPVATNGEDVQAGEITRFRTEDRHDLCDCSALVVERESKKKGQMITILIPIQCLYGYDPSQFDRLGFTYRINRGRERVQYFSANDEDFTLEQQPSFWASLKLKGER